MRQLIQLKNIQLRKQTNSRLLDADIFKGE
jgi:hypothetical protein